ncbi:MAG: hypothetical protein WB608_07215 [Terracidiphilus sp.]
MTWWLLAVLSASYQDQRLLTDSGPIELQFVYLLSYTLSAGLL